MRNLYPVDFRPISIPVMSTIYEAAMSASDEAAYSADLSPFGESFMETILDYISSVCATIRSSLCIGDWSLSARCVANFIAVCRVTISNQSSLRVHSNPFKSAGARTVLSRKCHLLSDDEEYLTD